MSDRGKLHNQNLQTLFYPKHVAVVGTNKVIGTVPGDIFINILHADLQGTIFPVSPREKAIGGIKAYKYVIDIEDEVDLAVIVFPSSVANLALEQCGQKGIKAVIIISAGFREVGEKGLEKEKELIAIAEKYGISFIGPNCLGVINTDPSSRLNASFARKFPAEGNIAFLSQSGALCTAVLDYAQAKNIGFSKFVSFGNKADISEIDLLYYLMEDEKTKVILLYLEEITDGPGLMKAAREVIEKSRKPILVIKSGRTKEGASAAASHTGSLAGEDEICDAAFKQAGIIRCNNIEEMFNIAIAFTYQPSPELNRVAIITNAGGPGVLTTDAAIKAGIQMARFSEKTTLALKRNLPSTANINNPIDVIGDARADRYVAAISAALKDESVGGIFVILTPQSMTDIDTIAKEVAAVANRFNKPVYTSFMGEADVASGIRILQQHNIPHYILPESMCEPFIKTFQFNHQLQSKKSEPQPKVNIESPEAKKIIKAAINSNKNCIDEFNANKILAAFGLPVPKNLLTHSAEEAASYAEKIGFPIVMKLGSSQIIHKSDVGGVKLNISTKEEAVIAFDEITTSVQKSAPSPHIEGIMVSEQIPEGIEIILGIKKDPSFGHVIMFGIGGLFVEILKDVSFRVVPIQKETALEMIMETKASKLLTGTRGKKAADINSLADAMVKLSNLAENLPEIKELDINPIIVLDQGKGCFVADSSIIVRKK